MSIERKLANKVFFSIHNDNEEEVNKYHNEYIDYIETLGENVDNRILVKESLRYTSYILKKVGEMKNEHI